MTLAAALTLFFINRFGSNFITRSGGVSSNKKEMILGAAQAAQIFLDQFDLDGDQKITSQEAEMLYNMARFSNLDY